MKSLEILILLILVVGLVKHFFLLKENTIKLWFLNGTKYILLNLFLNIIG